MAFAVMLLAGAGLLIRSFGRLQQVDPGFNPKGVMTFRIDLPAGKYSDDPKLRAFTSALMERMQRLPGVSASGVTVYGMPFDGDVNVLTFDVAGRPPKPPGQEVAMRIAAATPGYFKTLGIPVRRGRDFTPQDRAGSQQVVVINEAAARQFFPGEEPLGKRILLGWRVDGVPRGGEIVGIVGDFKQDALDRQIEPQLFLPYDQAPLESLSVVLRTPQGPQAVINAARTEIRDLDPALPIYGLQSMAEAVAVSTAQSRFYMLLLGGFAFISLVLAAIGIYGVIAYAVRQRTQEIGIRMALGATHERVMRMVVGEGLVLAVLGAAAGLLLAFLATRSMRSLLFEVKASDPSIYAAVAAVLVAVAAFASYLPARRAAQTDPQLALRGEV